MKGLIFSLLIAFLLPAAAAGKPLQGELIIFHAGSLAIPFRQMARAFEKKHPGVKVLAEAAGSRTCARKISDLGRGCDIMASADYTVIEELLIPEHAAWNISFADNEMAVMYRPESKHAGEINVNNWPEIMLREGVEYGHSDPNTDPCGYRTLITWQLAEQYYKQPGLYENLVKNCPPRNIRPKETDLIALLEAGELDYIFIYRSICKQHTMPFVALPGKVSLKSPRYEKFYQKASVKISGKEPGAFIEKKGASMVYGFTIPHNAPNPEAAVEFARFVISPAGRNILKRNGQEPIYPPIYTGDIRKLPQELLQ